jgi:hypothetical protein
MAEANRGSGGRSVDGSGIIRAMGEDARRALGDAVERHRNHRGWSRPQMAREANLRFGEGDPVLSGSTIKNVEKNSTEVTGRVAGVIERLFGWQTGTVANILAGGHAPDPSQPEASPDTLAGENNRAWVTFESWPKDVQDQAIWFGALLAVHPDEGRRRELGDAAFAVLLHAPI